MNEAPRPRIRPIQLILIGGAILLLLFLFIPRSSGETEIGIDQVLRMAEADQLTKIEVRGDKLKVVSAMGETFKARKEESVSILELLQQRGIDLTSPEAVQIEVKGEGSNLLGIFLTLLPLLFFGGLIFFMLRGSRSGINQAMNIGKSKARVSIVDRPTVTFDDVAGAEEAKQEMAEIVEFLKTPEKFSKLGAKIPRGCATGRRPGHR